MLEFNYGGDIFKVGATVLVNPVNTVGSMGAGLALVFKKRFPRNYLKYRAACNDGIVQVGEAFVTYDNGPDKLTIINFPTKDHWRDPTKLIWIRQALPDMLSYLSPGDVVAIPAIGAGLGGANVGDVTKEIVDNLWDKLDIKVIYCLPRTQELGMLL